MSVGLSELYASTIKSFNRQANDAEFDAWMDVLGRFSVGDIDAAIRRWRCNTRLEEFTGRPAGARMPAPVEISLEIAAFDRKTSEKFRACQKNGCMNGWVKIFAGNLKGSEKLSDGAMTWVPESNEPTKVDPKIGAAVRCQCWKEWAEDRRRMKAFEAA